MRRFRTRASVLTSVALVWQIVALMIVPAAAAFQSRPNVIGEMADCPMHQPVEDVMCPKPASAMPEGDCRCPRLGCSEPDQAFLALLGPVGLPPVSTADYALRRAGNAVLAASISPVSLAPVPVAPPPRA